MNLGRRTRAVLVIDLYGGSAAAVALRPATGRWPAEETRDRLDIAVGLMATTLLAAEPALARRIRHSAMTVAVSLVGAPSGAEADDWAERVAGRRLVRPGPAGDPRIESRLVRTRRGARVEVLGPRPTSLALSACASAVAAVCLRDAARDVTLSAALAMEGLLLWCGVAANRGRGPERALSEAYAYAMRRLAATHIPPPDALRAAVPADGSGAL